MRFKGLLLPLGIVMALAGAGLGSWAYVRHHQVQEVGKAVYKALEDDGMPLPPGVLDDAVFKSLPPANEPVSLGRYLPPKSKSSVKPAVVPPDGPPTQAKKAPQTTPSPPAGSASQPDSIRTPASDNPPPASERSGPFMDPNQAIPLAQQKVHILLIGNDQQELGKGRGDTLLTLTLDPKAQTLFLVSIPRDTRINLPGYGLVKINAAYTYGGANLQTIAVERFLGIPFDKYVEVSLGGFVRAIDAVGGVRINSRQAFDLDGQHIRLGPQQLSGEAALVYARMRYEDPEGDLGRNKRQQEVIRVLLNSLGNLNANELTQVLQKLNADVRTDFSPSEVVKIRAAHPYMFGRQQTETVQGTNRKIDGIWYYIVSDNERRRLNLLLR